MNKSFGILKNNCTFVGRIKLLHIVKSYINFTDKYHIGITYLNSLHSNMFSLVRTSRGLYLVLLILSFYSMRTKNNEVNTGNNSTLLTPTFKTASTTEANSQNNPLLEPLEILKELAPIHKFSEIIMDLSHEILLKKEISDTYKSDVAIYTSELIKFLNKIEKI